MTTQRLGVLRDRLCDLLELHPMQDWSPALLQAVTSVVEMYVEEVGLHANKASVLHLVPEGSARCED